jgi:hypothetical protein
LRAWLFRKLLHGLDRRTPRWLAAIEIQILLGTTARAFGVKGKRVWLHSPEKALGEYAAFTASRMQETKADPGRLYAESFRTGKLVRRITGFRDSHDIETLIFYLYNNIGITMEGNIPGEVTVHRCYFSMRYTPEQCAVMSSVDSGIIAGIAGRGWLTFTERLTEGSDRCRACFSEGLRGGPYHE